MRNILKRVKSKYSIIDMMLGKIVLSVGKLILSVRKLILSVGKLILSISKLYIYKRKGVGTLGHLIKYIG